MLLILRGAAVTPCEIYGKQSYRSRADILMPGGVKSISVPIKKVGYPSPMTRFVVISDHGEWRREILHSLHTAYGSSPYFEHYADTITKLVNDSEHLLYRYNAKWLSWICATLEIPAPSYVSLTKKGQGAVERELVDRHHTPSFSIERYWQVFEDVHGFQPHLSVLDLLCCLGPEARPYLYAQLSSLFLKS